MKIIIDAMGGDNAPLEIVKGTVKAHEKYPKVEMVLVGKESEIVRCAEKEGLSLNGISVVNAHSIITMEEPPSEAFRNKKDSSLCTGLRMLKEDGDCFISAGSTGALIFSATMTVRRLKGVDRPCLATILPFNSPLMLMDCGANIDVKPEYFMQWALLGSIYYKSLFNKENPSVGLLNIGTEETKGLPLQVESYKLLKELDYINFAGNIEGRDVPGGKCDVLLCDGFSGNILLKYTEGISKMFMGYLKNTFYKNAVSKISAALVHRDLMAFKTQYNYKNYGGAPVIGLQKPVFKAHGNSDEKSFCNAIGQAVDFIGSDAMEEINSASEYLRSLKGKE